MKKNLLVKNFLIFVFLLACTYFSFFTNKIEANFGWLNFTRDLNLKFGIDLSGGSYLVFEADTSTVLPENRQKALEGLKATIERRVNLFGISETNVKRSSFNNKERIVVELPGIQSTDDAKKLIGTTAKLVFAEIIVEDDQQKLKDTNLSGSDLKSTSVEFEQNTGKPVISLTFSDEGAKKFAEITERLVGQPLAIVIDGNILQTPVVNEKIIGGQAQISGTFSLDEANAISTQLNSGALPLSITLVEEKTIGPSLGVEAIDRSLVAGIIGISAIVVFMLVVYGLNGLVAVYSLFAFTVITLTVYKLVPVVLTLPGIAGFLLSVGMAVDSNILIFERLKEELREKSYAIALESAFGRAWDSIRDANVATLVTAFILANPLDWNFLHVSGPVRGFAVTLALGIAVSLFTGIVVSRSIMRLFARN